MRRLTPLLAALVALAGCGSSNNDKTTSTEKAATTPATSTPTAASPPSTTTSSKVLVSPTKDLSRKPRIPRQPGDPPSQLMINDIVKGKGPVAKPGAVVTVRYVGVRFRDNQQFDASWDRTPNAFTFPLGQGQVIQGWDKGVAGMRVGGRRQLTIPPDLAYGAQGAPPDILPNETLVFVVDLKKVKGS